jgi:hypothetical protein
MGKCLIAGMSLLMGLVILYLSYHSSFLGIFGAFVAIVAAVLWAFQALLIWKRSHRLFGANDQDHHEAKVDVITEGAAAEIENRQTEDPEALTAGDLGSFRDDDAQQSLDDEQLLESPVAAS